MDLEIREFDYSSTEYEAEIKLRNEVMRKPLGLLLTKEELDRDKYCFHIGAFLKNSLVGCLVLKEESKTCLRMRQVAVYPDFQRRGIGIALVQFAEAWATKNGYSEMTLNARETVISFYSSLGYEAFGDPFISVTIPHRSMKKLLPK